jgi:DNA-binding transcriptional LysR family regulator
MDELSLTGLRTIREVAQRGSFSAAAEALGYTQSAVSRQVALVELNLGSRLFDRRARGVELTPQGAIVLRHGTAALAELQSGRRALAELDSKRPARVHLGAFSTAMAALVPNAVVALGEREQRLAVTLHEGTSERLLQRVGSGRLDLAVVTAAPEPPDGLVLDALLDDRLLVAMSRGHRRAGQSAIDPDELRDEQWIAGSADPQALLLGAWTTGRWRPQIAYVVRDWNAKLGLVAAGCGITVVPALCAASLPADVIVAAIDHPAAMRTVAVARREGTDADGRVVAVLDALREAVPAVTPRPRR